MASKVVIDIITNASGTGMKTVTDGLGKIAATAALVAAAGVAAFVAFGKEAIAAAGRVSEMNAVLEILAKNAGLGFDAVSQHVEAVKGMGIETAIAQGVVADFIKANLDMSKASDLARVAQDAAVLSMSNSSETLNDIVYAITTLNPLILRNRGIVVDSQAAYKKYAKEIGKTESQLTTAEKQQALMNAVLEAGIDIAGAYEASMESAGKQIRSWPRYLNDILVAAGMPFQKAFNTSAAAVSNLLKSFTPMLEEGGALYPILLNLAEGAEKMADNFADFLENTIPKLSDFFTQMLAMTPDELWENIKKNIVDASEAFRDWMKNVDWAGISQQLIDGLNGLDWVGAGETVRAAAINVFDGIADAANEIDWGGIAKSAALGLADFSAALGGGDWETLKSVWADNFKQLETIAANRMVQIGVTMRALSNAAATNVWMSFGVQLGIGLGFISVKLQEWTMTISAQLNQLKNAFVEQFRQMVSAATARVQQLGPALVDAVVNLLAMIRSAIKPIAISISLPNFAKLAEAAAAGMAMLNAALGGDGTTGNNPKPPRDAGGNVIRQGVMGAKGGVFSGPTSGYPATLHGTEAIVPLEGGNIPVSLTGGGGGMVVNLTYAPAFSTADRGELLSNLVPVLDEWFRRSKTS